MRNESETDRQLTKEKKKQIVDRQRKLDMEEAARKRRRPKNENKTKDKEIWQKRL